MTITETTPLTELELQVRPSIAPLEEEARAIRVVDQATYDQACEVAKRAVEARKTIKSRIEPGKTAAHAAWKEWMALENEMLELVTGAERIAKGKIAAWNTEQERLRRAEEARLAEEARKQEEEDKLQAATAAEADGASEEEVEAILEEPAPQTTMVAPPTYRKSTGVSTRETWKAEVTHLPSLIKFVAANPRYANLLKVNTAALNALAVAQKQMFLIPGAKAIRSTNVAIR